MFLLEFFPSGVPIYNKFFFFFFLTLWTYFSSVFELIALRTWNSNLLKFLRYLQLFRKYNEKRFCFVNSAPLQCTAFLLFGTYLDLKWVA